MLKRCNKYININNIEFNLKGVVDSEYIKNLKFDKLKNCYARPSDTKVHIYIIIGSMIYQIIVISYTMV